METRSYGCLTEVLPDARPLQDYEPLVGEPRVRALEARVARLLERMGDATIWNLNSTAVGGGVAEMLRPLVGYARGSGVDLRWVVIDGDSDFFHLTKRLHHALHGSRGDGRPLDEEARAVYEETLQRNASDLLPLVKRGDVVILHDPQTAGLVEPLLEAGARVVWRCHIGQDEPGEESERGWAFLAPYLERAHATVFSRAAYVPACCDGGRSTVIQPGIDPFSPKNQAMAPEVACEILVEIGILEGPPLGVLPAFTRPDRSPGRVERAADVERLGRAVPRDVPLIAQVSRWDPLKDPIGVLEGFRRLCEHNPSLRAELLLAGPNVRAVTDDPEGAETYDAVEAAWRDLPHPLRKRVHLAMLPMEDVAENAAMVNAIQRHACIVVQKSLHEGFGLTVTEAMWKGRAVLASAVGGIRDQMEHDVCGYLLADPGDLDAFARLLHELLADPARMDRLGKAARERVREHFLGIRQLEDYAGLIEDLLTQ